MAHVDHFSSGVVPVLAYAMSCIGCALGLLCTSRARSAAGAARARWFVLAGMSIGGTGIWVMHFIAMLGFKVGGTELRYAVAPTVAGLVLAVVVVTAGLVVAAGGRSGTGRLIAGGVVTGLGVAGMHYLGMAALRLHGEMTYDTVPVVLSVLIAVAAATAALWFALNVRGALAITGAALVMAIAVTGMHYVGMLGIKVRLTPAVSHGGAHGRDELAGAEAAEFLAPLITGISLFALIVLFVVALSPGEQEMREEDELDARLARVSGRTSAALEAVNADILRTSGGPAWEQPVPFVPGPRTSPENAERAPWPGPEVHERS